MSHRLGFLIIFSMMFFGALLEKAAPQSLLTNKGILDLVTAGMPPKIVVAKISASPCRFDTSPAQLKVLRAAGVSDDVILAMVQAPVSQNSESHNAIISEPSAEVLAERANRDSCPACRLVLISNINSENGEVTDDWVTTDQDKWLQRRAKDKKRGKQWAKLITTKHRENADYIIFWTSAQGFRPYITYEPHTEMSTANVSGVYTTYGKSGATFGNLNGIVMVARTYYTAETNQHSYMDVNLVVYDRLGKKVFETWHQGNWRWSKPDEDCLEDAFDHLAYAAADIPRTQAEDLSREQISLGQADENAVVKKPKLTKAKASIEKKVELEPPKTQTWKQAGAQPLEGDWDLYRTYSVRKHGSNKELMTLIQQGNAITGKSGSEMPYGKFDGLLNGNGITLAQTENIAGKKVETKYIGKIDRQFHERYFRVKFGRFRLLGG